MKVRNVIQTKTGARLKFLALVLVFVASFSSESFSQKTTDAKIAPTNLLKVTQIDEVKLKELLKPNGKPILVNFWATWCEPCREEFPDLVKINAEFKGKIDFITVSLDDLEELNRDVPKFLGEMKAEMPAYLLKATNDDNAISSVSKDWSGGLPFTMLINEKGETVYFKQAKIKLEVLRIEINKLLVDVSKNKIDELPLPKIRSTEEGREDAQKDIANGILSIKRYGYTAAIPKEDLQNLKIKYGIEIVETGCVLFNVTEDYFKAYNERMKTEIQNRFGVEILKKLPL